MAKFFIIVALLAVHIALAVAASEAVNFDEAGTDKSRRGLGGLGGYSRLGYPSQQLYTAYNNGGYYGGLGVPTYGGLGINSYGINNGLGYNNLGYGYSAYPGIGLGQLGYGGYPGLTAGRVVQPVGAVPVGYALH